MEPLFELRLVRNAALATEAIAQAVRGHEEVRGRLTGPTFSGTFLVLPIAFHRRSAEALATRRRPGALFKAVSDEPEIRVGLQARLEAMADLTLEALNLCFASGVLTYDGESGSVIRGESFGESRTPGRADDVAAILNAAKRVGHALAETNMDHMCGFLGVGF